MPARSLRRVFSFLWLKHRDLGKTIASRPFLENSEHGKWVLKSKPWANRSIFQSHFVLMSKHNTTHGNCCDPRNPPKRNIDILFVQRETLYNLHSLMTVHGNTGWRPTSVPHLALIQLSLWTHPTESPSVHHNPLMHADNSITAHFYC